MEIVLFSHHSTGRTEYLESYSAPNTELRRAFLRDWLGPEPWNIEEIDNYMYITEYRPTFAPGGMIAGPF